MIIKKEFQFNYKLINFPSCCLVCAFTRSSDGDFFCTFQPLPISLRGLCDKFEVNPFKKEEVQDGA